MYGLGFFDLGRLYLNCKEVFDHVDISLEVDQSWERKKEGTGAG